MKTRNKLIQLTFIVLLCASLGCTKDVEIALPEYKPTLVIHSYISPKDSGVIVYVNLSKPAYNSNYNDLNNVTNATVKLSDGVNSRTLVFYPSPTIYGLSFYYIDSNSFKIAAGKTYTLTVNTPDGKAASASTVIPGIVPINSLDYHLAQAQFGDSVYKFNFTFTDPKGQDDYYKFGASSVVLDTVMNEVIDASNNEKFGIYFNSDGNLITENMDVYRTSPILNPDQIHFIDFRLMHVTREYYLYHQSINNGGGGGPFTEPSVPFTNVTGGVGVFAGYNYDQRIIR